MIGRNRTSVSRSSLPHRFWGHTIRVDYCIHALFSWPAGSILLGLGRYRMLGCWSDPAWLFLRPNATSLGFLLQHQAFKLLVKPPQIHPAHYAQLIQEQVSNREKNPQSFNLLMGLEGKNKVPKDTESLQSKPFTLYIGWNPSLQVGIKI